VVYFCCFTDKHIQKFGSDLSLYINHVKVNSQNSPGSLHFLHGLEDTVPEGEGLFSKIVHSLIMVGVYRYFWDISFTHRMCFWNPLCLLLMLHTSGCSVMVLLQCDTHKLWHRDLPQRHLPPVWNDFCQIPWVYDPAFCKGLFPRNS